MKKLEYNASEITAVVLADGADFGRCPVASDFPPCLWPVDGVPAIARILHRLAQYGINRIAVCDNSDNPNIRAIVNRINPTAVVLEEKLPSGTAGCLRNAALTLPGRLYLLIPANLISVPDCDWLIKAYTRSQANLVAFSENCGAGDTLAGIYVLDASAASHIPAQGYSDLKEGLIPALWRTGKTVRLLKLPAPCGLFRDRQQYLKSVLNSRESARPVISSAAKIARTARIIGPVILKKAVVEDDAIIIGPAVIEDNVCIRQRALVQNSVVWPGAEISPDEAVQNRIVACNSPVQELGIQTYAPASQPQAVLNAVSSRLRPAVQSIKTAIQMYFPVPVPTRQFSAVASLIAVLAAFILMYLSEFKDLVEVWTKSDEYSSGMLVPALGIYIMWSGRNKFFTDTFQPCVYGLILFIAGQAIRIFGEIFWFSSAQRLSIIVSFWGVVLFILGFRFFKRAFPVLLFLVLMLPMPKSVHANIMTPLQNWATASAVFSLETCGFDVAREGNIIHIGNSSVAVAEACNGLRMITAFLVISSLVVLVIERAWWEKFIILLSALPIGLLCNTLRLTLTSIAFTFLEGEYWEKLFHDFGGIAMMPVALGAIILELWLLKVISIEPSYREKSVQAA